MSVTIQDDMMAAALAMPRKQGDAFLVALLRYGFLGEEPGGKQPWYPTFITCKDRVDLSVKRSSSGGLRNRAKTEPAPKQTADLLQSKNQACSEANADFAPKQTADLLQSDQPDIRDEMSRDENEVRREEEANPAFASEAGEIIDYLNEVCGTSYKRNSATSRKYIGARLAEGYTVDDCKRVIDNKAADWLASDEMRQYLRPTTLFRKEKFEGYLQAGGGGHDADYSRYDAGFSQYD